MLRIKRILSKGLRYFQHNNLNSYEEEDSQSDNQEEEEDYQDHDLEEEDYEEDPYQRKEDDFSFNTEEEEDEDYKDLYPYHEEIEDCNLILSNLPAKQADHSKEEEIKERSQQIQEQPESLHFVQDPENKSISIKKRSNLSRPQTRIKMACYIPERNILLVLHRDGNAIDVYSTFNYKLLKIIKNQVPVNYLNYNQHLKLIMVSGEDGFLQLWSIKDFQVKFKCDPKDMEGIEREIFSSVEYIPESDVIIVQGIANFFAYNTELKLLGTFELQSSVSDRSGREWFFDSLEMRGISQNLIFIAVQNWRENALYLLNLKTWILIHLQNIYVPPTSCVEISERSPVCVFTCLTGSNYDRWHFPPILPKPHTFKLTQFAIKSETEELIEFRHTLTNHIFSNLRSIKNTKYFLAQKFDSSKGYETFLLSVDKNHVEILHILSRSVSQSFSTFTMTKDGSSLIEIHEKNIISLNRIVIPNSIFKSPIKLFLSLFRG